MLPEESVVKHITLRSHCSWVVSTVVFSLIAPGLRVVVTGGAVVVGVIFTGFFFWIIVNVGAGGVKLAARLILMSVAANNYNSLLCKLK